MVSPALMIVTRWCITDWCVRRKKPTGKNAKAVRDDTTKELFEHGEWARDETTMERVGKSVLMYSFVKERRKLSPLTLDTVNLLGSYVKMNE
jgi:hypothetical protein